jgi:deoxyribodipyrimidine photo-lyase
MQTKQKNTGLVWFRNNLRVHDNQSLSKATENHEKVIAVYFFNPKDFTKDRFGFKKTEKYRAAFLIETIKSLQLNLEKKNTTLLVYFESP